MDGVISTSAGAFALAMTRWALISPAAVLTTTESPASRDTPAVTIRSVSHTMPLTPASGRRTIETSTPDATVEK